MVLKVWLGLCLTHIIAQRSTRTALKERSRRQTEEPSFVPHGQQLAVLRLRKDTAVNSSDVLITWIGRTSADLLEFETGELLEDLFADLIADLLFGPFAFLFDVEAADVDVVFGLPPCECCDTDTG